MADCKRRGGSRMTMLRIPAYHGATKLVVLGCVAGAVGVVLRAAGDERDLSGLGQARRRLDAAISARDQAERRLRAGLPGQAAPRTAPARARAAALPHEAPLPAPRAAASAAPIAAAARGSRPPFVTFQPSRHDGPFVRDAVWLLAIAAHESGLRIGRLGPAPAEHGKHGAAAGRRYDLAGTGSFGEVARWLRALAREPATFAPLSLEVTRRGGGAVFSARFSVHDGGGRPAAGSGLAPAALPAADAFEFGGAEAVAMPRVAGILRDARGGLALLDAGGRARSAAVGERIGAERITRIAADGVWLEADDGREQRVALGAETIR